MIQPKKAMKTIRPHLKRAAIITLIALPPLFLLVLAILWYRARCRNPIPPSFS